MTWRPKDETARAAIIGCLAPILNRAACAHRRRSLSFNASASAQPHFVGITPGAYVRSGAPGARMHSDFKDNIAQILGSVGRDVSSLSGKAQAAAVIVWLDKTNPPPEIVNYVQVASLQQI